MVLGVAENRGRRRRGWVAALARVGVVLGVGLGTVAGCSVGVDAPGGSSVAGGAASDSRPVVLTTFTVLADLAGEVAGDRLRVESITKIGAEIHGYEPTPGDLRRAADADLILDNGLGLEAWFERFVAELDVPHVVLSAGLDPIGIEGDPAHPNPHAWMSPAGGAHYARAAAEAFADLDPAGASEYRANAETLAAELATLGAELRTAVATIPPERRVLVTCEGAFSYLARDAGLEEAYVWPVNAEQQATPRRVARVIDLVREREVPAVFCESTVSAEPMERVAESSGTRVAGTLYVDSLSAPDGPVPTYLDLLRHDVDVIVAGLTGPTADPGETAAPEAAGPTAGTGTSSVPSDRAEGAR